MPIDVARSEKADLIIIGSHKLGFSDYFLDLTASRVVKYVQYPVIALG